MFLLVISFISLLFSFCLRAGACGFGIDQVDSFFVLRGRRTRGLRSRPLVNHRSQRKGGEEENPSGGFRDALRRRRTRGPSGRALLSITRPQRTRREDPPRLWTPPYSAACVPWRFGSVAQWGLVQRRMEQVPSRLSYVDLQGAISMLSGSDRVSGSLNAEDTVCSCQFF